MEFGNVGFYGGRKTLGARTRTNNELNPHMTPGPGIEPGPHWWKASALTTAPSLPHPPAPGHPWAREWRDSAGTPSAEWNTVILEQNAITLPARANNNLNSLSIALSALSPCN